MMIVEEIETIEAVELSEDVYTDENFVRSWVGWEAMYLEFLEGI